MEAAEAIFDAIEAAINADTGAGGLLNTAFDGYVRGGVFMVDDTRALTIRDRPQVRVEVSSRDKSPNPAGATPDGACEFFDNVVTLWVIDHRDQDVARRAERTAARLRALFQFTTLSTITDADDNTRAWYFAPMARINLTGSPPSGHEIRIPLSFRLPVSKGTV